MRAGVVIKEKVKVRAEVVIKEEVNVRKEVANNDGEEQAPRRCNNTSCCIIFLHFEGRKCSTRNKEKLIYCKSSEGIECTPKKSTTPD